MKILGLILGLTVVCHHAQGELLNAPNSEFPTLKYECMDEGSEDVLLEASVSIINVGSGYLGIVSVAGIKYIAKYRVEGLDRRWDFSSESRKDSHYALVIDPRGEALYYDFSDIEEGDSTFPSDSFVCVGRKAK